MATVKDPTQPTFNLEKAKKFVQEVLEARSGAMAAKQILVLWEGDYREILKAIQELAKEGIIDWPCDESLSFDNALATAVTLKN